MPCLAACSLARSGSRRWPSQGTNITAAIQDTSRAMATTSKIERVYSPVLDCAVAIGRKPAAVISVPVSIGKAVLVQA
ncbi:hypothetical protein D3C77_702400 [compost metagenome]